MKHKTSFSTVPDTRLLLIAFGLSICLQVTGCAVGSLASSTGNRDRGEWSIASHQKVYVDEEVEFSFVLRELLRKQWVDPTGRADYCKFYFGAAREDVSVDGYGGFKTSYRFKNYSDGDRVEVKAVAFLQVDDRDEMNIAGEWVENGSPHNRDDLKAADARLVMEVYTTEVRYELPALADGYDFSTAQLIIRKTNGDSSIVYPDRPYRRGFKSDKAESGSGWVVTYEPLADQLNSWGTTETEFSVYDNAGNRHRFSEIIDTP